MDSASFAASAGEALLASMRDVTRSSTNKLRDVSRKVTLARLLDERTVSNSRNSGGGHNPEDKENSISDDTKANTSGRISAFSERNPNLGSSSMGGKTSLQANRNDLKALRDLRDLCSIVSEVERRGAALRDAIDSRRRDNVARRKMIETTRQQTAQLARTLAALPEHLPHAAAAPVRSPSMNSKVAVAAAAASNGGSTNTHTVAAAVGPSARATGSNRKGANPAGADLAQVPVLELVTVGELNAVPRSTRARLTIEHINGAVKDIQKAMERRHALISKPRKKMSEKERGRLRELMQQEVPAHGGEPFITEPALRALPAFRKGEMTAKALIATLRNLKRLKGVRGAGMMTYVVRGG